MARTKGTGILRRPRQFAVRVNDREYEKIKKLASRANINMSDYARCKMLDIPFEEVGGVSLARKVQPASPTSLSQ